MDDLLDSFCQFLGEMVSLEELKIRVWCRDGKPGGADLLAQVLRCVGSPHLKKCVFDLAGTQYGCKRSGLLNTISGEAMQQCLQHLPSIPEFFISLWDNDAAFGKNWWTTEITKNLPSLRDTLTVNVWMNGMLAIEWFIEGLCTEHILNGNEAYMSDLWAKDLPVEAASSM